MADDDAPEEPLTGVGEEPEMIFDPTVRRFVRRVPREDWDFRRLFAPAALGIVTLLFVAASAFYTFLTTGFTIGCTGEPLRGANIDDATGVAFVGGIAGAVLIGIAWRVSDYLVAACSVLGAAVLGVAVALVAVDSATYVRDESTCTWGGLLPGGKGTSTEHVGYLYGVWGVPLVALLVGSMWALRRARLRRAGQPMSTFIPSH
jgi:hypothetical protein